MKNYNESTHGERTSDIDDDLYSEYNQKSIEILSELARNGPVLELGIGTGHTVLSLKRKGEKSTESMLLKICLQTCEPGGLCF